MIFGREKFFNQDEEALRHGRKKMLTILFLKGFVFRHRLIYIEAYEYFANGQGVYDGATIVKDLHDMPGLDFSAMVHDYRYGHDLKKYSGWKWLSKKYQYDYEYGRSMERLGKGYLSWIRFALLVISTPFYWLIYKFNQ